MVNERLPAGTDTAYKMATFAIATFKAVLEEQDTKVVTVPNSKFHRQQMTMLGIKFHQCCSLTNRNRTDRNRNSDQVMVALVA